MPADSKKKGAELFIGQLISDEAFRRKIEHDSDTPEKLAGRLAAEGYEFSEAEWNDALKSRFGKDVGNPAAPLADEELAELSGGNIWSIVGAFTKFADICFRSAPYAAPVSNAISETITQVYDHVTKPNTTR